MKSSLQNSIPDKLETFKNRLKKNCQQGLDQLENYQENISDFSYRVQRNIKKNPLTAVTLAAVGGWLLGRLFK